jgi:spore coat protein A
VIDRRIFLSRFLGTGAALALGAPPSARAQAPGAATPSTASFNPWLRSDGDDYGTARAATFASPLPIPKVLRPSAAKGDRDRLELEIRRGLARPLPGKPSEVWGYDGVWPGPTLEVRRGRAVRVRVHNRLDEPMSIHNHGISTQPESDGHPLDYIRPGASKEYLYPNQQPAGTYWLHDHAFGLTGPHVYRGLAGFYIVRDAAEDALGLPSGEQDVPIMLQDRLFDADNAFKYQLDAGTLTTGVLGNSLCSNGVHGPYFDVAARRYRFRFLNGSNSRNYRLTLSSGDPLVVVASDGSLLEAPVSVRSLDIAPGERWDCVVDFARHAPGTKIMLGNLDPTWPTLPEVLRFHVVQRAGRDTSRVPARLSTIARLPAADASVTRRISFQLSDGRWTMNGLLYDPARIDFRPRLGTVEIWELVNEEATQMHPFHQHLVPFQVLDVNGRPPPPELLGWKDTVAVPPHGSARIIMRFTGFKGIYVFHCHKLEHEDHAMMLQQEVT